MRRRYILPAVLALAALIAADAGALTYEITIHNEIPGGLDTGQPFSPPVAVVHGPGTTLWAPGAYATPGLVLVAEEGDPATLAAEAMAGAETHAVVVGTGPFFDPQTILIEGEPGDLFSVAWMLGRTNDLFSGLHDVVLPDIGTTLDLAALAWDAGSEVNTGLIADLGFYGHPMAGTDEYVPIASIDTYSVVDDPDHGLLTWTFPPCGRVVIVPMESTANAPSSWGSLKALFE